MASNFRISTHRNSDNLHLKLIGDFDGSSACELLNAIKKGHRKVSKIFIHCDSIEHIHPFGRNVLYGKMGDLAKECPSLVFTGKKARHIAPERNVLL